MKIAIPLYDKWIAPRFDCAQTFLLATAEKGEIIDRVALPTASMPLGERINALRDRGVDTLICSGIDKISAKGLIFDGIHSYAWVTGEAEDALQAILRGELESGIMVGAGGRRCGRWRFIGNRKPWEKIQKERGKDRVWE